MTKRVFSLQDLGEKGRITTGMKYLIYNEELKKELHSHKVGRALLVLKVLERNTRNAGMWDSSPVYLICLFTHTICVYITVARAIL